MARIDDKDVYSSFNAKQCFMPIGLMCIYKYVIFLSQNGSDQLDVYFVKLRWKEKQIGL